MTTKPLTQTASAFAPATVANIACGFDVLGLALETIGDTVKVHAADKPGASIKSITGDGGRLPRDPDKNTASIAVAGFLEEIESDAGVAIEIEKGIPLSSGLGSSAASAVAAVHAANELFGSPLPKEELLIFALDAEKAMTGAGHADNVAPALFGGVTLIRDTEILSLPFPEDLIVIVAHPEYELNTRESRSALPKTITLEDAAKQWSHLASLIVGFCTQNTPLIGRSLKDHIIETYRGPLIPGFEEVKEAALDAGALGCSISGAGPSVFAMSDSPKAAAAIGQAMADAFHNVQLSCDIIESKINKNGCQKI
jgi:homoserine kinase